MLVTNRHGNSTDYRYGFNGIEKDDELKGEGNSYDFGARMYDPRLGRWFATDKAEGKYPSLSPYNYTNNNPLIFKDIDGNDIYIVIVRDGKRSIIKYDRNMSEKGINKSALETIKALHVLYDSKAMEVRYPDKDKGNCVDVLGYFMKPENDLVIMPVSNNNKSFPSRVNSSSFEKYKIDVPDKYDDEINTRNTGFIQFNPNQGIIFSTTKTVQMADVDNFKKSVNLRGLKGFGYYSNKFNIGIHSPLLQFAHEIFHSFNMFKDFDAYTKRTDDKGTSGVINGFHYEEGVFSGGKYLSGEEFFVIQQLMPQVNETFNAPNPHDHVADDFNTSGSTTVEPIDSPDSNKGG